MASEHETRKQQSLHVREAVAGIARDLGGTPEEVTYAAALAGTLLGRQQIVTPDLDPRTIIKAARDGLSGVEDEHTAIAAMNSAKTLGVPENKLSGVMQAALDLTGQGVSHEAAVAGAITTLDPEYLQKAPAAALAALPYGETIAEVLETATAAQLDAEQTRRVIALAVDLRTQGVSHRAVAAEADFELTSNREPTLALVEEKIGAKAYKPQDVAAAVQYASELLDGGMRVTTLLQQVDAEPKAPTPAAAAPAKHAGRGDGR